MATCLRVVSSNASRTSSVLSKSRGWATRNAHSLKPLPYPIEGGLGKFLPPKALQTFVEYQDGLLQRLNHELRTDPKGEAHSKVAQVAIRYSERKERTLAFNYAVLALNNSFFLDRLTPPPPEESEMNDHESMISAPLREQIRVDYGDTTRLKSTFSAAALGTFTNGWIWMVMDTKGGLGILQTLGPSTLLIRSRSNMAKQDTIFREPKPKDKDEPAANVSSLQLGGQKGLPPGVAPTSPSSGLSKGSTPSGALDPHARVFSSSILGGLATASIHDDKEMSEEAKGVTKNVARLLTVGDKLFPLFCVPTYEHAWMSAGYGVWGKEDWLKEFWTALDWSKVSQSYQDLKQNASSKF